MDKLHIGVVGIGFGQHVLVPAFRGDERCEILGIAASTRERAAEVAARLSIPRAYGGWQELCADRAIDAVVIALPPARQPEVALAAARAGKHLFCEKPVALDEHTAAEIYSAAREQGVVHAVDFEFREIPAWRELQRLLAARAIGSLRQVQLSWRLEILAHRRKLDSWKVRLADGGGTLNTFVSHSLYSLEWLFGPILRLNARLEPSEPDIHVDAWLEFAAGFSGALSVGTDLFLGSGHRLEVFGDQGTLVLHNPSADYVKGFSLAVGTRDSGSFATVIGPGDEPPGDGRIAAVGSLARRFVDAIQGGKEMVPNLQDGVRVQSLIDTMRRSHRSGGWQSIPN